MAASERNEDAQSGGSPFQDSHSEASSWLEVGSSAESEFEETSRSQAENGAVELAPTSVAARQADTQTSAAEPQKSAWSFLRIPLSCANRVKTDSTELRAELEECITGVIQRFVGTHVGMSAVVVSNVLLFTIGFLIGRRRGDAV